MTILDYEPKPRQRKGSNYLLIREYLYALATAIATAAAVLYKLLNEK